MPQITLDRPGGRRALAADAGCTQRIQSNGYSSTGSELFYCANNRYGYPRVCRCEVWDCSIHLVTSQGKTLTHRGGPSQNHRRGMARQPLDREDPDGHPPSRLFSMSRPQAPCSRKLAWLWICYPQPKTSSEARSDYSRNSEQVNGHTGTEGQVRPASTPLLFPLHRGAPKYQMNMKKLLAKL